jgi:hypothetical protein
MRLACGIGSASKRCESCSDESEFGESAHQTGSSFNQGRAKLFASAERQIDHLHN